MAALEQLRETFPFFTRVFQHPTKEDRIYFDGTTNDGKRILMSCQGRQWLLSVGGVFCVVSIDSDGVPDEIVDALIKIKDGEPVVPTPRALALKACQDMGLF